MVFAPRVQHLASSTPPPGYRRAQLDPQSLWVLVHRLLAGHGHSVLRAGLELDRRRVSRHSRPALARPRL